MDKNKAKEAIQKLVDKYEDVLKSGTKNKHTEEETKKGFIVPLFTALGWDMEDRNEVTAEEHISGDRVDYGFYISGRVKFYLEAKPLKADLMREDYANQAVRYSWNKGVNWAILTDFESIKVFYSQDIKKHLSDKLFFSIPYNEYIERFDQLWLLSKESFRGDLIDKEAERVGKKLEKISVTTLLYKDLNKARELFTEHLRIWNEDINPDLLDEGVQKLLNRLVFIRVAEDRKVEDPILRPLIRNWRGLKMEKDIPPLYKLMVEKFRELDKIYNSNLFSPHSFEKWKEEDNITEEVINIFYGKPGYYEYDFKVIPADVLGTVYENYLGYRQAKKSEGNNLKKRKEQGIYYTPNFIVDYIVENTLGLILENCYTIDDVARIKVLDPACGSGSFLVKAMEAINKKYKELGDQANVFTKIQILTKNLYGVDLDEQAVEIARLNLLLNTFDSKIKLPDLGNNIKNGNSLISGTDEELKKHFGKNWRDKKAFNWYEEFPEVFKQGGFDVVVGNPPYNKELDNKDLFADVRKSQFAKYYQGKMDFWYFFMHRAIEVSKDGGIVGFITNSYFLKSAGVTKLIDHLRDEMVLIKAVDFEDITIFEGVSGRHLVHIWEKTKNKDKRITEYLKLDKASFNEIMDDGKCIKLPYVEIIKNSSINFETNIQTDKAVVLLGDSYDTSVGVQESTDKVSKKILEEVNNKEFKVGDGVFVLSGQELKNLNLDDKEKLVIKNYLNTNNVQKYHINFDDEYLIYSDKETKIKIADGEYPHIKSHLDKMKKFITSSNAPYGLHRPREDKYFENPKLICKGMFLSPEFCFDDERYYVGFSFSVIIQKDKDYNLKYLLGLLNSNFGKNWFNANGKKRGIGVDIGVAVFRKFPVYKATKTEQAKIVVLVDKMLTLNDELYMTTEDSNEWQKIKDEIQKIDNEIDEEVNKLYGLTLRRD